MLPEPPAEPAAHEPCTRHLHAVVRHAVARRTEPDAERLFSHYVTMLERHPERLELEQSHLFAAMEHASRKNDLHSLLRIEALARKLSDAVA